MAKTLLLKNGICLIHTHDNHVESVRTDVLIEGNKIAKISKDTSAIPTEVIDCSDKIISPGFIDTHHHVWSTQLKGRHANETLIQYMASGNFTAELFTPADIFWGQLGGCLEMLNCGTTTVADYAHMNYSQDNNDKAIAATVASGIRSIFCYSPNPRVTSWDPFTIDPNGLGGHALPTLDRLAKAAPYGNGRVKLGFAFDGFPFLPKAYLDMLMAKLDDLKIPLIQLHYCFGPLMGKSSIPKCIDDQCYLDNRFLIAHSANMPPEDVPLYRNRGVHLSTTPSTELQMAMGFPVPAFNGNHDATDLSSLGIDCHSIASSYIPGEARLALQSARAFRGQKVLDTGKQARSVGYTVEEAFNQATVRGAQAVKMADKIGSIAVGKFADLIIFDATSPAMICAAAHDPVAAVVLHSSPADVDTVIVDGHIRKRNGTLISVDLDEQGREVVGGDRVNWSGVGKELLKSRARLQQKIDKIDMQAAEQGLMKAWHIRQEDIVDVA